jgi:hypothetical protein
VQASAGEIFRATVSSNTSLYANIGADGNGGWFGSNADLRLMPSGTERARIDSSGRLLVGTSSNDSNALAVVQGYAGLASGQGVLAMRLGTTRPTAADTEIGSIRFESTSNTSSNYHYASISAFSDGASSSNTDIPGRLVFSTTADGAASPTERMRINSAGEVSIGSGGINNLRALSLVSGQISTSSGLLTCATANNNTNGRYVEFQASSGGVIGSITQSSASAVAYNTSSDYRLKENVAPINDGITRLQQLKPSRFNFIIESGHTVDGFIAHEAQAVVPECVTGEKDAEDDDGKPIYQGIDQSKMVPLAVAAIQECVKRIESLEAELALLKATL